MIGASAAMVKLECDTDIDFRYRKEDRMDTETETIVGHRTRVYVAGPYTKGDVALNVKEAVRASDELLKLGYAPYCPHLTHFWHMLFEHDYQTWLDLDNEWVTCCDALLRIPGDSSGADKEVALAESLGLPVFFSIKDFVEAVPITRRITDPDNTGTSQSAKPEGIRGRGTTGVLDDPAMPSPRRPSGKAALGTSSVGSAPATRPAP